MGEKALIDASLNVTALRNNFFINHFLKTDCETIDAEGWFSNPLSDMRNSFVATRDIAEAAPVILTEGPERHGNKFYDITGQAPQSMVDFEYLTNGFYTRCSPGFYNLTGHKPTSYFNYLTTRGASGEKGLEELYQGNLWKKGVDAMKDAPKT